MESKGLKSRQHEDIWIISDGRPINLDLSNVCKEPVSGPVVEYRISELARYLLNPNPITLEEKVVGCKVYYEKPAKGLSRLFQRGDHSKKKDGSPDNDSTHIDEIISGSRLGAPGFKDTALNTHFKKIHEMLRPYDPVYKKLTSLEKEKIEDVKALCEDIGRNRYQLTLQGSINDKIGFVSKSLSSKTKVVANRAYLLNGLFEMRGYNFSTYNRNNETFLIKLVHNGQDKYCVLSSNYQFEYWVNDPLLVNYMHILQQCIQSDPKLRDALTQCSRNNAKPLKLFFAKQLGQDYSDKHFPSIYREMLNEYNIGQAEKEQIVETLNKFQNIISFNYVPLSGAGKNKLCTNISVMHDVKALLPIRSQVPRVYSEIDKMASRSDAGKLYLLDSMRGYQNV